MKVVVYSNLFLSILVPSAFGMVWMRLSHWVEKCKFIFSAACYLGRMTYPIMFLHIPVNTLQLTLGYGRFEYTLIGILIPIVLTSIFGRYSLTNKLFGLPSEMRIAIK